MRNKSNLHVRLHSLASLDAQARVALDHQQQHYLMHVMRLGDGDQIYLFNAANGEWQARLDVSGGNFQAICSHMIRPGEPLSGPVLYCSPIRRVAQEWLLQKACELGVSKLTPVLMDHTQAGPIRHDRAESILREASEQSGRVTVPIIDQPISFDAMLELTKTMALFVGHERMAKPCLLAGQLAQKQTGSGLPVAVAIGPEGGMSDRELDLLAGCAQTRFFSLGRAILRAETAAIAALAVLMHDRESRQALSVQTGRADLN